MHFSAMRFISGVLAGGVLWPGLASSQTPPPAGLEIEEAWVLWVPGTVGAGCLSLTDGSADTKVLLGTAAWTIGAVHQSIQQDGMTSRRRVASIELKPRSTVEFYGEAYHLMLIDARRVLGHGHHVKKTLEFEQMLPIDAEFKVCEDSA